MPLDKQLIPVSLKGLDEKSPKGSAIPGTLDNLTNGYIRKGNQGGVEFLKRLGSQKLAKTTTDGSTISSARKLFTFRDELLLTTTDRLYSWSSGLLKWVPKGFTSSFSVTSTPVSGSQKTQRTPDTTIFGGLQVSAWEENFDLMIAVSDATTGVLLSTTNKGGANPTRPRVVGAGANIWVFWLDGSNVLCAPVPTATGVVGATQTIATDGEGSTGPQRLEAVFYPPTTAIALAYLKTGTDNLILLQWPSGGGAPSIGPVNTGIALTASGPIGWCHPDDAFASGTLTLLANYGANYRQIKITGSTMTVITDTSFGVLIGTPQQVTGYITTGGTVFPVYEYSGTLVHDTFTGDYTQATIRSLGIASQVFRLNSQHFVLLTYASTLQPTYFLYNLDLNVIVAKSQPGTGGGNTVRPSALSGVTVSGNTATIATLAKTLVTSTGQSFFTTLDTQSLTLNYADSTLGNPVEIADSLFLPGGLPQIYDGANLTEHQFNVFPEVAALTSSNHASGNMTPLATYQVVIVYRWIDAQGTSHRSAPSPGVSITLGAADDSIQAVIPTYRATPSTLVTGPALATKTQVTIETYVTKANDTALFLVATTDNNPAVNNVSIDILSNDAAIAAGEPLYTTGGVLENLPAPPCRWATVHKNRVFVGGCERKAQVVFTFERVSGLGMAFNDAFIIEIPETEGTPTAGISMDGYMVTITPRSAWTMAGDYPDSTGGGPVIPIPRQLQVNAGADEALSAVLTSAGIIFNGQVGFTLIDRGLNSTFIGAQIEDTASQIVAAVPAVVTGAHTQDDLDQVRWTMSNGGLVIVYDLYFQRWYKFIYPWTAVASWRWRNAFISVDSTGQVYQETPKETPNYLDDTTKVFMTLTMSFLSFAGLQGFQRIYLMQIFGRFLNSHTINVTLAYDHNPATRESFAYDASTIPGDDPERLEIRPKIQKCTSIQAVIFDSGGPSAGTQGYALSSVGFTVGVKGGLGRMPNTLRIAPT